MTSKSRKNPQSPKVVGGEDELAALRKERDRLKKALAAASLRADAFDEMINVAEKMFNIPIRKKSDTDSNENNRE